jgi:hypothetical protein
MLTATTKELVSQFPARFIVVVVVVVVVVVCRSHRVCSRLKRSAEGRC